MPRKKEYKKSENDELYKMLFGDYPTKSGKAYEVLSTAALEIASHSNESFLDQHIKGDSGAIHQLDGRVIVKDKDVMLEAKDYKNKIGLGIVRGVEGAITDLPVNGGYIAGAGFTRPAKLYAKGTNTNPRHKKITLLDIRGSKTDDLPGRMTGFRVSFSVTPFPEMDKIEWFFVFSQPTIRKIIEDEVDLAKETNIYFVDSHGIFIDVYEVFEKRAFDAIKKRAYKDKETIQERFQFPDLFAKLSNDQSYPVDYLQYTVPVCVINDSIIIKPNGNPVLYIKSDDGTINKLITDTDLREWGKKKGILKDSVES